MSGFLSNEEETGPREAAGGALQEPVQKGDLIRADRQALHQGAQEFGLRVLPRHPRRGRGGFLHGPERDGLGHLSAKRLETRHELGGSFLEDPLHVRFGPFTIHWRHGQPPSRGIDWNQDSGERDGIIAEAPLGLAQS